MSAGPFIKTLYQADSGLVFPTKLQPETELASFAGRVNDAPAGPATPGAPYLAVVVGKRSPRLQMRYAIVRLTADGVGQTAEYKTGNSYRVVVGDPATYALWARNAVGTYLGIAAVIDRMIGEVA